MVEVLVEQNVCFNVGSKRLQVGESGKIPTAQTSYTNVAIRHRFLNQQKPAAGLRNALTAGNLLSGVSVFKQSHYPNYMYLSFCALFSPDAVKSHPRWNPFDFQDTFINELPQPVFKKRISDILFTIANSLSNQAGGF